MKNVIVSCWLKNFEEGKPRQIQVKILDWKWGSIE